MKITVENKEFDIDFKITRISDMELFMKSLGNYRVETKEAIEYLDSESPDELELLKIQHVGSVNFVHAITKNDEIKVLIDKDCELSLNAAALLINEIGEQTKKVTANRIPIK